MKFWNEADQRDHPAFVEAHSAGYSAGISTANATIRDLEADLSALKQRVAEVLAPFVCFEEQGRQLLADARQEDDKSASRLFNSWNFRPFPTWGNFRRAAELHASLRSSEGQPTDEGRRVSSDTLAEPDEAALERAARKFLAIYTAPNESAGLVVDKENRISAMRAALSSLTVTGSGE